MKLIEKFNRAFGFTPSESRIVVFLVLAFVVGAAIKISGIAHRSEPRFDYSKSDSVFAARAAMIPLGESSTSESRPSDDSVDARRSGSSARRSSSKEQPLASKSVDINTAAKGELVKLPGIGEAIAERIIMYREEHGGFKSVSDLLNVKGIGKKKLERLIPFITTGK